MADAPAQFARPGGTGGQAGQTNRTGHFFIGRREIKPLARNSIISPTYQRDIPIEITGIIPRNTDSKLPVSVVGLTIDFKPKAKIFSFVIKFSKITISLKNIECTRVGKFFIRSAHHQLPCWGWGVPEFASSEHRPNNRAAGEGPELLKRIIAV